MALKQTQPLTRRKFLYHSGLPLVALAEHSNGFGAQKSSPRPNLNVLLILVDDLRTELGCFGSSQMSTPHIDRLADSGITFLKSYCQQAESSPSRTSILTGLRPDTTRVFDQQTHFRRFIPNAVTLPQQFRQHGYQTAAFGKVFQSPLLDDRPSWSIASWIPGSPAWRSPENERLVQDNWEQLRSNNWASDNGQYVNSIGSSANSGQLRSVIKSWNNPDVEDQALPDGLTARTAAAALASLQDERFFLAVGFQKPHLPFVAPKRFFDLYPSNAGINPDFAEPPRDAPLFALHQSDEIRNYMDIPEEGSIPGDKAMELIRAYRACVSYTDAQIGLLLDTLADTGLVSNTIVVVIGDNGSHLGELGLWNKNSNYEAATHTPLIVRAPQQKNSGRKSRALTESVDIYPTLCDLCGIPRPEGLEGSSYRALFDDPVRLWKRAVFSQHPRDIPGVGPGMGYSMRTSRYRYTEWSGLDSPYITSELYDYRDSPHELRNIANKPENVSLVNGLSQMLREGWGGSLPPTELPYTSRV